MFPVPIPGSGQDGQEPTEPACGDGFSWEDEDAWAARLMAETDADEIWVDAGSVEAALAVLAGGVGLGGHDLGGHDLGGLAQGGPVDLMAPGPGLAAVAAGACDPAVLGGLCDNEVLGLAAAGRRLAGRAAWIQQAAVAEFAARRLEPDGKKATPLGFTPFAPDELAPDLVITGTAAEEAMARARDAARRLPANFALLRDGKISEFQIKIITDATVCLSDADAAEADRLLAAAAAGLTPGQLRAMAARVVMMIDPAAAVRRRERAARDARIERFQEHSGNAALCGRELPPPAVLASSQHIDACARALRKAGIPGTLARLRVTAYLDLTQGLDPLARIAAGATDEAPGETGGRDKEDGAGPAGGGADHNRAEPGNHDEHRAEPDCDGRDLEDEGEGQDDGAPEDDEDGEDGGDGPCGGDGPRPGASAGPGGGAQSRQGHGRSQDTAPVKATITLLVPAGTLLGWSSAPGEIAGFGLLDPQATRDLTQAASAHPQTRWCVTVVGDDGTATAHGCAPGQHPWTPAPRAGPGQDRPGGGGRDGPGLPGDGPPEPRPGGNPPLTREPSTTGQAAPDPHAPQSAAAEQAAQVTDLLRRLRVRLAPIAKGRCDHRHYSDRYVISRKVKHLLQARAATCTAPGCNRPAAGADADHTLPWPAGPSCECNLGPPCRYHHRNKQAPGWRLDQPQPGVMRWHTPSGRTHTTYPTKYMI